MKITLRNLLSDEATELDKNARIEFGSGLSRITVSVIDDMVHVSGDGRLTVFPRAANLIYVQSDRT
jgi:hypothetical protein